MLLKSNHSHVSLAPSIRGIEQLTDIIFAVLGFPKFIDEELY